MSAMGPAGVFGIVSYRFQSIGPSCDELAGRGKKRGEASSKKGKGIIVVLLIFLLLFPNNQIVGGGGGWRKGIRKRKEGPAPGSLPHFHFRQLLSASLAQQNKRKRKKTMPWERRTRRISLNNFCCMRPRGGGGKKSSIRRERGVFPMRTFGFNFAPFLHKRRGKKGGKGEGRFFKKEREKGDEGFVGHESRPVLPQSPVKKKKRKGEG